MYSTRSEPALLRRPSPPPHPHSSEKRPHSSFWLVVPDDMTDTAAGHETPLGACLLPPKPTTIVGWGNRRRIHTARQPRDISSPPTTVLALEAVPDDPPSPSKKRPPPPPSAADKKRGRPALKKLRAQREKKPRTKSDGGGNLTTRWSAERYEAAETKLVAIMQKMGAGVGTPVARQAVRDEARKHIGDTGLLDHLLKHMVGKTVAGGTERLRRQHSPDGAMHYWLEPAELADIRQEAGVTDPYWVPPPGWKLGDPIAQCPCGEDCEKEARKLGEEVASVKREFHRLLEWKRQTEEEMAGMSGWLQALKQEVRSLKEEKHKKAVFAGVRHSTILRTA